MDPFVLVHLKSTIDVETVATQKQIPVNTAGCHAPSGHHAHIASATMMVTTAKVVASGSADDSDPAKIDVLFVTIGMPLQCDTTLMIVGQIPVMSAHDADKLMLQHRSRSFTIQTECHDFGCDCDRRFRKDRHGTAATSRSKSFVECK